MRTRSVTWLALAMTLGIGTRGVACQTVDFPDPALEAAVRASLGVGDGAVTTEDLLRLEELRVVGAGVADLSGLEGAENLRKLVVGANRLTDLSPVADLPRLEELHAWFNRIADVGPLAGARALTHLQLGANRVTDLTPLRGLRLTHLDLAANDLDDVSALSSMTSLRWLELSDNRIDDLGPLAGLSGLRKLWLWRNRIGEVSALGGLTELRWLDVGANQLGDVGPLLELPSLATLLVHDNFLNADDPDLIRGMSALRSRSVRVRYQPQRSASFWATTEDGR